jgi:ankyrin repeat protein
VQFSHFSVKEFLTSPRLATASGEVSNYHIDSEPAHTVLAQACLGILLQIQDDVEGCTSKDHPLAKYAAEHWTTHAQFGKVSSRLHKGMEYLFDANKPHFKVWLTLYDIDTYPNYHATFHEFAPAYSDKHPQDVNTDGGYHVRPLVAALAGEHFQTADLLRHNGAGLDVRGHLERNPLHAAASSGNFEVVRMLIECYPTDINARDVHGWTPLLFASGGDSSKDGSVRVVRLLLEHGADMNAQAQNDRTPLQWASMNGALEVVRLLLEHGSEVEAKHNGGKTTLQVAVDRGHAEVVELLREHGSK